MKHFFFSLIIGLCTIFSLSAIAQGEQWDTYMAKFGDKPGSVMVDLGQRNVAPDKKYPYLVITGPKSEHCNKQGLPNKEDIDALEEVLDASSNFITGVTPKVLVGTFTYNCERLNYYYVKDTIGIRNALMRMYNRGYSNYSYVIKMKYDPQWLTYRTFLYPTEETLTWMQSDKIITKMLQDGDSLTKQRNINFSVYFRTDSSIKAFTNFAATKGYKINKGAGEKNTDSLYHIILSKYSYVKIDAIDSMAEEIKTEAKKDRGYYDEWYAPLSPADKAIK